MYKKITLPILSALIAVAGFLYFASVNKVIAHIEEMEAGRPPQAGYGAAITYQGSLTESGSPAEGVYDFVFELFDTQTPGTGALIGRVEIDDQPVSGGLFTVELDFGDVFDGTPYWLQVSVRPGGSTQSYTPLAPRQALSAAPYAHFATRAESASWTGLTDLPAGFADNLDDDLLSSLECANGEIPKWDGASSAWRCADDADTDTNSTYSAGTGLELNGGAFSIASAFQLPQSCPEGAIAEWIGGSWVCGTDDIGGGEAAWSLTGNAGTSAGTHFLGTTDNQPLELHVNGQRALLLQPDTASPNLVSGYGGNSVGPSTSGATVGGGGRDLAANQANGDYSTVDGGADNTADGYASVVGGGEANSASGSYSAAGGGAGNSATGSYTAVGGGRQNLAGATYAVIAGGQSNATSAAYASILGGQSNEVTDTFGTIAGGVANEIHSGYAVVGGGSYNLIGGAYGIIAGGGPSDPNNPTTTNNQVWDDYGSIGGGGGNRTGNDDGIPTNAIAATVGGGRENTAAAPFTTIAGGDGNTASGYAAMIGGGAYNSASNNYAAVAGGSDNSADGQYAAVPGGRNNSAEGSYSTIGGGYNNQVTAGYGAIPGGIQNYVGGNFGLAAGYQANAGHQGAFVWSDSTGGVSSTGPDQFLIDADGGVGIGTDRPTEMLTVDGSAALMGSGALIGRGIFSSTQRYLDAPSEVYASGTELFVTSAATNTLTILDVSNPDEPRYVSHSTSNLNGPADVQVVGQRAYVASKLNNRLVVFDISDPSSIDSLGSVEASLTNPVAVYVTGKYAYVAFEGDAGTYENDGLVVFDISDPSHVNAIGFTDLSLEGPSDVYVSDGYAYVASRGNGILVVLDATDPRSIQPLGVTSDSLDEPVAVRVRGSIAYVLDAISNNLVIFDVSDKHNILTLGQAADTLTRPSSLFISGDNAYVTYAGDPVTADNCGIAVFDISNPSAIETLAVIDLSDSQPGPAKPVAIYGSGNYLYVANELHNSLAVYEIHHLQTPAATAGTVRAGYLEVNDNALINNDLVVDGGLNVGSGGARIAGGLSVASRMDSHILGALSVGGAGATISDTVVLTRTMWITAPTHALDVIGEGRFRVNDYNNLLLRSPNTGGDEDAYLDFFRSNQTSVITPSARIEFDAADPLTHTTSLRFYTQAAGDAVLQPRVEIAAQGNLRPSVDNQVSLGDSDKRWTQVFAVNGVIQTSDGRYKQDVADLAYGLDEITHLRPVTFRWVDHPEQGQHYGLIAQEAAQVLPDLVEVGDDPHHSLGMNYAEIIPVLVKAVQEQQAEIDTQSQRIASLEARLAALEKSGADKHTTAPPIGLPSVISLLGLFVGGAYLIRHKS